MSDGTYLKKCFGYSATKGGRVGERHRWSGPSWGKGRCIWCHRDLQQLTVKPEPKAGSGAHLARALQSGQ